MTTPPDIDPAIVEVAARALCKSGLQECGEGACSFLCLGALGIARQNCSHAIAVHGRTVLAILQAVAPLLVKGEREACARVAERKADAYGSTNKHEACRDIAAAIRERGKAS